jgi:CarD family transcriptional regulator
MFKVGDKVVYPGHGVGVVEDIQKRDLSGTSESFYILRMCERCMTIMVPTANSGKIGLREVIAEGEVSKVLDVLKKRESKKIEAWNRRSKHYTETIKSGCVYEIAKIYRELTSLKSRKTLSFGEKRVLDSVRGLVAEEISQARGISKESAITLLDKTIAK